MTARDRIEDIETIGKPNVENPFISAKNVNVHYGDNHAIKDVSLQIAKNQVIALIGPSGCGKSTFIRCINRMNDTIDIAKITGKILVGTNSHIKDGCVLEGPLIIGSNCVIDSGAHIGPNTSVGDNTKISKCNISDSIIMSNCIIDCDATIKQSIISTNSTISENKENDYKLLLLGEGTKIIL